jgi:hypothetical protein
MVVFLSTESTRGGITFDRGHVSPFAWRAKKDLENQPRCFGIWGGWGILYPKSSSSDHL